MTRTAFHHTPAELAELSDAVFILSNREAFYELLSDLDIREVAERINDECELGRWLRGVIWDWREQLEQEE